MKTLTVKDETAAGKILQKLFLDFETQYVTVRELIEARIREEIKRFENDRSNLQNGLVIPGDLENRLNNKKRKPIDVEKQVFVALDAFLKNGFFILIDDEQTETLEQQFLVDEATQVTFIKLTPLVGG